MGCRLIIHMRKARCSNLDSALPWQPPLRSRQSDAPNATRAAAEALRVGRLIHFAQRAGLPPAVANDLELFWDDPILTQNGADDHQLQSTSTHSSSIATHRLSGRLSNANSRLPLDCDEPNPSTSTATLPKSGIDVDELWIWRRQAAACSSDDLDTDLEDAKDAELFVPPMACNWDARDPITGVYRSSRLGS